jgi:DNA-binding LacI/PurR family transcriptional regulator
VRMATIKDLAKEAKVSIATVSRYLNGKITIKNETKKRIDDAVTKLNYRPNYLARSLILNETETIGVVVPDILNPYFSGFARGVEDEAKKRKISVILCNSDNDVEKEKEYLNWLQYKNVDGIVLVSTGLNHEFLEGLITRGTKVVIAGRRIRNLAADFVSIANIAGAGDVVDHLIGLGHRNIAAIIVSNHISTSADRLKGYKIALKKAGIDYLKELVIDGKRFRYETGYESMIKLLERTRDFTAVFAFNDLMAIGAINALQDSGISVPNQVSVVGFDGLKWGTWIRPSLTSFGVDPYEYGSKTGLLLLNRIAEPDQDYRHVKIKGQLIIRNSTIERRDL